MKLEEQNGEAFHIRIANDHVLPNSSGNNRCLPAMCISERTIEIPREGTFAHSRRTVQFAAQGRRGRCQAKGECCVEICFEKVEINIQKPAKAH